LLTAISSLKRLLSIVAGLAVTNATVILITGGTYRSPTGLDDIYGFPLLLFFLLVSNILRFYHGNNRHLDTAYVDRRWPFFESDPFSARSAALGVDFIVIFLQCVLLAIMSFFIRSPSDFFLLFIVLMAFDVAWYLVSTGLPMDPRARVHQLRWSRNNVGALVVLVLLFFVLHDRTSIQVSLIAGVIAINTAIDFWISWWFYFPRRGVPFRVFIAAEFTEMINPKTGMIVSDHRALVEGVSETLESFGMLIDSAHQREEWGSKIERSRKSRALDQAAIISSDLMVVVVDHSFSPGLVWELGVAAACQKPVLLAVRAGVEVPYLLQGMEKEPHIEVISYREPEELERQIGRLLKHAVEEGVSERISEPAGRD